MSRQSRTSSSNSAYNALSEYIESYESSEDLERDDSFSGRRLRRQTDSMSLKTSIKGIIKPYSSTSSSSSNKKPLHPLNQSVSSQNSTKQTASPVKRQTRVNHISKPPPPPSSSSSPSSSSVDVELEHFLNKLRQFQLVRAHHMKQLQSSLLADLSWDQDFSHVHETSRVDPVQRILIANNVLHTDISLEERGNNYFFEKTELNDGQQRPGDDAEEEAEELSIARGIYKSKLRVLSKDIRDLINEYDYKRDLLRADDNTSSNTTYNTDITKNHRSAISSSSADLVTSNFDVQQSPPRPWPIYLSSSSQQLSNSAGDQSKSPFKKKVEFQDTIAAIHAAREALPSQSSVVRSIFRDSITTSPAPIPPKQPKDSFKRERSNARGGDGINNEASTEDSESDRDPDDIGFLIQKIGNAGSQGNAVDFGNRGDYNLSLLELANEELTSFDLPATQAASSAARGDQPPRPFTVEPRTPTFKPNFS